MTLMLWLLVAVLAVQWLWVLWNMRQLPSLREHADGFAWEAESRSADGGDEFPRVSLLIPARNEAHNIGRILSSVLNQQFAGMEVIVLDDGSQDDTAEIVKRYAARDSRLRLMQGREKPSGWTGKAYACHQLAEAARAPWLFFLDADACLEPGALDSFMKAAYAQGGGLLTGFPRQALGTPLEKLVVPMMMFTVACHLPIRLVRTSRDSRFAAAHGACMLIRRDAYEAAGGHGGIRDHLVDDVALARRVKHAGYPVVLAKVHPYIHMRMYRSSSEVWLGYRKNIFPGLGRSTFGLAAILSLYAVLYLLPLPLALAAALGLPGTGGWLIQALAAWAIGVGTKAAVDGGNGLPKRYGWLLPLSILAISLIAIDSWRMARSGKGYRWKGRTYS